MIFNKLWSTNADNPQAEPAGSPDYQHMIEKTADMVTNASANQLAQQHHFDIVNVTWEDTARYKDSAVGPNISDMTIQVQALDDRSQQYQLTCMPVIRFPNFSDRSADIPLDLFYLLVGNEKGQDLQRVTLKDVLSDPRQYLSQPETWTGAVQSLLAERDTHALVSAQACFLPVPKAGIAQFNPVLFNYQSYTDNPAVLTILATREGTSMTVIDNTRDAFEAGSSWGQRLFFNQNGQRASFTGQRLSDFQASEQSETGAHGEDEDQQALNLVLLIQVPLKQQPRPDVSYDSSMDMDLGCASFAEEDFLSDVEEAVIGHGEVEGPFTEMDNLAIERDPDFPIRVTVQFYKATSNGVMSQQDMQEIAEQIDRVYQEADYVGSLVVSGETRRPTEYSGDA